MLHNPCPACRSPNRPTARRCGACGAALLDFDTEPAELIPAAHAERVDSQVGALWFDDLVGETLPPRHSPAPPPADAAGMPGVVVRELRLRPRSAAATGRAPAAPATLVPPPPVAPMPAPPAPPAATASTPGDRAAIKVARRAAVRRARLSSAAPPALADVLVMDTDNVARNQLDALLAELGFRVRPVATLAQAAQLAAFHAFAAVFVAVPPGAIDGAVHDLFEGVREACRRTGAAPAVRVLLAAQWSPVDRVRAELAGCEATLTQPPSRRDIARVLDANGVVLPRDPRRT